MPTLTTTITNASFTGGAGHDLTNIQLFITGGTFDSGARWSAQMSAGLTVVAPGEWVAGRAETHAAVGQIGNVLTGQQLKIPTLPVGGSIVVTLTYTTMTGTPVLNGGARYSTRDGIDQVLVGGDSFLDTAADALGRSGVFRGHPIGNNYTLGNPFWPLGGNSPVSVNNHWQGVALKAPRLGSPSPRSYAVKSVAYTFTVTSTTYPVDTFGLFMGLAPDGDNASGAPCPQTFTVVDSLGNPPAGPLRINQPGPLGEPFMYGWCPKNNVGKALTFTLTALIPFRSVDVNLPDTIFAQIGLSSTSPLTYYTISARTWIVYPAIWTGVPLTQPFDPPPTSGRIFRGPRRAVGSTAGHTI